MAVVSSLGQGTQGFTLLAQGSHGFLMAVVSSLGQGTQGFTLLLERDHGFSMLVSGLLVLRVPGAGRLFHEPQPAGDQHALDRANQHLRDDGIPLKREAGCLEREAGCFVLSHLPALLSQTASPPRCRHPR